MAEIKLQKKKPVWPWILLALVLIGLVAFLLLNDGDDDDAMAYDTEQVEDTEQNTYVDEDNMSGAVEEYVSYIETNEGQMGIDHEYTHKAFTLLTAAMQATAQEAGYNFDNDIDKLNDKADKIMEDPMKLTHANTIKDGFEQVSASMDNMQQESFPDMKNDLNSIKYHLQNLNPDEPTLDQKESVKGFFDEAAKILESMNNQNS
ncbi:MAG: hypothetical protein WBB45_10205 [Cyclobacteriaceae bacterium]